MGHVLLFFANLGNLSCFHKALLWWGIPATTASQAFPAGYCVATHCRLPGPLTEYDPFRLPFAQRSARFVSASRNGLSRGKPRAVSRSPPFGCFIATNCRRARQRTKARLPTDPCCFRSVITVRLRR